MTFYEISRKMLRANFKRYRIYFFCNLFAAALFYCFASILTNASFRNGRIVNSLISGNIYFPSILAALFLVFFLPVSGQVFLASRKQEYGILFSLGMSRKEAFWNMFLENVLVAILALVAALAAGTVLSVLFFAVIQYGIGIEGLHWKLNPEPYKITIVLYTVVIGLTFVLNAGSLLRERIGVLIKMQYRSEKKGLLYRFLYRFSPAYMKRHMAEWSFLRRHKKEWGIRYLFAALIAACSVMLVSVCVTMYPAFLRDAKSYAPYDMVYSEIYGMNIVPEETVAEILKENGVTIKQSIQIPYIRSTNFNFFPVEEINQYFQCDYQIEEGQFLNLFQYDLQDGYEHDLSEIPKISYGENEELHSVGSDVRILWNQNPTFADRTLIVSHSDFEKMKEDAEYWTGVAHLFLFEHWEDSYDGVCAVNKYLRNKNEVDETEAYYFNATSKIESYSDARKSGQFLIFLMAFVIGLMLTAEFLLIHFRIQAEEEENGRAVCSLQLIGMTEQEIMKCLKYKNTLRFIPPILLGAVLAFLPSYYLNGTYGAGGKGILTGAVFGIVIAAVEWIFLERYSQKEFQAMRSD
ncbi:MAG: FtsX-like permease family protein [Eubacteriales bacterium]|nr:FtsX-like permease family protein [Eubacteriales bacterium]